jgi:SAM-dependent methyltransferase
MAASSVASHWDAVFSRRDEELSWYEPSPRTSLELILSCGPSYDDPIVDVGAGRSTLALELARMGFKEVSAVDVSDVAMEELKRRAGLEGLEVRTIVSDARYFRAPLPCRVWHSRALLHFMTSEEDLAAFTSAAKASVAQGGHVVIGCFGPNGPTSCSGLPTRRFSAQEIAELFGEGFSLVRERTEHHRTPAGHLQEFVWAVLRKDAS